MRRKQSKHWKPSQTPRRRRSHAHEPLFPSGSIPDLSGKEATMRARAPPPRAPLASGCPRPSPSRSSTAPGNPRPWRPLSVGSSLTHPTPRIRDQFWFCSYCRSLGRLHPRSQRRSWRACFFSADVSAGAQGTSKPPAAATGRDGGGDGQSRKSEQADAEKSVRGGVSYCL